VLIERVSDVVIIGNNIETQVERIDGNPLPSAGASAFAWGVYIMVSTSGTTNNWMHIEGNNFIDGRISSSGEVVGGLAIDCDEGTWAANDRIKAAIKGNTFQTSCSIPHTSPGSEPFFNLSNYEAYQFLPPASFPYTIFVSNNFDTSVNTGEGDIAKKFTSMAQVHLTGNSVYPRQELSTYDNIHACKVYLPHAWETATIQDGDIYGPWPDGQGGICFYKGILTVYGGKDVEPLHSNGYTWVTDNVGIWRAVAADSDLNFDDYTWKY
jgi:hypothetical protein